MQCTFAYFLWTQSLKGRQGKTFKSRTNVSCVNYVVKLNLQKKERNNERMQCLMTMMSIIRQVISKSVNV